MWLLDYFSDMMAALLSALGLHKKEGTLLLVGLDNAGKSTLLHRLSCGAHKQFAPTERPYHESFEAGGVTFKAWDLGGHDSVRHMWDEYFVQASGVVFLVDAAEDARLDEAAEEIGALANDTSLWDVPIVIMFNKADLPAAVPVEELTEALGWDDLAQRDGPIQWFSTSVMNNEGVEEAMQWLAGHL